MDQRRREPSAISGGMTALIVVLGFIGIMLVGIAVTSAIRDPERAAVNAPVQVPPATQGEPSTAPPQNPTQMPATQLPPDSKPGSPSPNVPAPTTPTP